MVDQPAQHTHLLLNILVCRHVSPPWRIVEFAHIPDVKASANLRINYVLIVAESAAVADNMLAESGQQRQ
jgi:hypothetical protein